MMHAGLKQVSGPGKADLGGLWTTARPGAPCRWPAEPDTAPCAEPEPAPDSFRTALVEEIPSLRRFARALVRDRDKADDVVHDCLVRALSKWQSFRPGTNLRAWLMAILHHTFVSDVRRRRPQGEEPANWDTIPVAAADETLRLQLRDLERGLAQLPREQRTTLLLVVIEGMSYEQAAAVTGVPVGTIRSRLARARDGLRRFLQDPAEGEGAADQESASAGAA